MASIWFMETAIHREVHMIQQSRPFLEMAYSKTNTSNFKYYY